MATKVDGTGSLYLLDRPNAGADVSSTGQYWNKSGLPMFTNPDGVDFSAVPAVNHISGLTTSNDTDTDHDINVTSGMCSDSTNLVGMYLAAEQTKQIDASWATGDDAGGLSSSLTVANDTWYYIFVVLISDTVEILIDTSVTCANGVADHSVTNFRRIGAVLTDGSANILGYQQYGDYFSLDAAIQDYSSNSTTSAALVTVSVPPNMLGKIKAQATNAGSVHIVRITEVAQTDSAASITNTDLSGQASISHYADSALFRQVDGSSQIRHRASVTCAINLQTQGWLDTRGRNG